MFFSEYLSSCEFVKSEYFKSVVSYINSRGFILHTFIIQLALLFFFFHLNWRVSRLIQFDVTFQKYYLSCSLQFYFFFHLNWRVSCLIQFDVTFQKYYLSCTLQFYFVFHLNWRVSRLIQFDVTFQKNYLSCSLQF